MAIALSFAAQAQDLTFDIPAGDLNAALTAYSKQTGQQVVFKIDDLKGKTTPGVHGAMTPEQALTALLAGTGLKVQKDPSGAIAIFPAEAVAGGASDKTAGDDQKLEEVIVTATAVSQIYVTSRSGTRLDTDPMNLPISVSAVQGDLLQQQQARTLTDVLNNVAGVDVSGYGNVTMRGFGASLARNGTIETGTFINGADPRPTVSVDRVEVVKGPEQIMQGNRGGIGGLVNVITKRPEANPYAYLGAAGGSDGYWRLDADVNDTLLGDETNRLMGRLIGSSSGAGETSVGYDGASSGFASAGLGWENTDWGSNLGVVYEYNSTSTPDSPLVATQNGRLHSGMKEWAFGANNAFYASRQNSIDAIYSQRLWQDWTLNVNYIWSDTARKQRGTTAFLVAPDTMSAFTSQGRGWTTDSNSNNLKLDIRGSLNTGPVEHKLLLAYDDNTADDTRNAGLIRKGFYTTDLSTGVKTFDPAPRIVPASYGTYDESGLLLVDQVNWEAWSGLFGVRWVSFDSSTRFGSNAPDKQSDDATLPQYGLVYRITPDVSLYASGGEGFQSNASLLDVDGKSIPNETSTQYEGGVKALLLNQRVAVTLALYRIEQKNLANIVAVTPDEDLVYTTIPGLTSKGVELEVSGQPIRGLQMRANFTYTKQEYQYGDNRGEPPGLGYVPLSFNLWSQYWLSRNVGQGWWGGLGVTAKDSASAPSYALYVPGYTTFDLQAGYSTEHWSAIAGYRNVADIQTFYPTIQFGEAGTVQPGSSFQFDLSYRF
ncbi:MAG: TonB-dependent receptor [Steroidobacteraceae bacterium]